MRDKKSATRDALPESFTTLEELWGFWDTHSSADYEDTMEAVEVEIDLSSSKVYFPVAKDLPGNVRARHTGKAYHRKP